MITKKIKLDLDAYDTVVLAAAKASMPNEGTIVIYYDMGIYKFKYARYSSGTTMDPSVEFPRGEFISLGAIECGPLDLDSSYYEIANYREDDLLTLAGYNGYSSIEPFLKEFGKNVKRDARGRYSGTLIYETEIPEEMYEETYYDIKSNYFDEYPDEDFEIEDAKNDTLYKFIWV